MKKQRGFTLAEVVGYLIVTILFFSLAVKHCNEVEAAVIECIIMPVCEVIGGL